MSAVDQATAVTLADGTTGVIVRYEEHGQLLIAIDGEVCDWSTTTTWPTVEPDSATMANVRALQVATSHLLAAITALAEHNVDEDSLAVLVRETQRVATGVERVACFAGRLAAA